MRAYLSLCLLLLSLYGTAQFRLKADSGKVARLNTEDEAEAYPFLSADGLRLYYTSGTGRERIYVSERSSIDSPFADARLLSRNLPSNLSGATLTANELEIYLFDVYRSYHSKRKSIKEEFPAPAVIRELGTGHRRPSISPDGNELVALYTKDTVQHFRKNPAGIFIKKGTLDYPEGFTPASGQFSKDGLHYIMTVNNRGQSKKGNGVDSILILKYSRNSPDSPFGSYETIFNELDEKPFQITMDASRKILIAVLNTGEWKWESNNLVYFVVEKEPSDKPHIKNPSK